MGAAAKPISLLRLYVDGGSRGNPGPAACGVVITDADNSPLVERGFFLGRATNNVAEYQGLLHALELAAQFAPERIEVFSDSELMVRQITGEYRVKNSGLAPLFEQCQIALLKFDSWQIRHVPRAQNARADELANKAMDAKADIDDAGGDLPEPQTATLSFRKAVAAPVSDDNEAKSAPACIAIRVLLGCDPRICPSTMLKDETFVCHRGQTPEGLCLYAASAVIPAAAALLRELADHPERIATFPPLKVTCPRPGCNAVFEISAGQ